MPTDTWECRRCKAIYPTTEKPASDVSDGTLYCEECWMEMDEEDSQ
jgi:hypothetical protein